MEKYLIYILARFKNRVFREQDCFTKNRIIEKAGHFKSTYYISSIVIFGLISFAMGTKVLASQCRGPDPWFNYSIVIDKINPASLPEGVNITKRKDVSDIEQYVIDNKNVQPIYLSKRIDNPYLIDEPTQYLPLYKLSDNKVYSWGNDEQLGWGWYESFSSLFDISSDFFISDLGVQVNNKHEDDRPLVIHVPDQQKFTVYSVYNDIGLDIQNPQDYHKSEADKIFTIDFLISYKLNEKYDPKAGEKNKNRCDKRENSYKGLDISVSESFDSGRRNSDFSDQENSQITETKQPDNTVVRSNSERAIINYLTKFLEQFKIILIKFLNIFTGK